MLRIPGQLGEQFIVGASRLPDLQQINLIVGVNIGEIPAYGVDGIRDVTQFIPVELPHLAMPIIQHPAHTVGKVQAAGHGSSKAVNEDIQSASLE